MGSTHRADRRRVSTSRPPPKETRPVTAPSEAQIPEDPAALPTILIAAGRHEDDPTAVWTALLEIAQTGSGQGDVPARSPSTVAESFAGVDAAVARLGTLLDEGYDRSIVVPAGVHDPAADPPTWRVALAAALDSLSAAHPAAEILDLGRAAQDPAADALARVLAIPRNDSPSMLAGALVRGFGGDPAMLARFIASLRGALPEGTTIALRGSAVTGRRHAEDVAFDADGPGTSDLDVVAIGEDVVGLWVPEARLMGGINTLPLSDKEPWVAPTLDPTRREAQSMVKRPLSIQAMAGWFLDLRGLVQGHPYVILDEPT
jgi:hypothetical protein